jgi:hypothetical protein
MLGSGSTEAIDEMLQYAHETQHEKIIRGLAVGIAFICYGKQEQADTVIEKLLKEKVKGQNLSPGDRSNIQVCRTPFSAMAASTRWLSRMPAPLKTVPSRSFSTLLCPTPLTTYDARL